MAGSQVSTTVQQKSILAQEAAVSGGHYPMKKRCTVEATEVSSLGKRLFMIGIQIVPLHFYLMPLDRIA